MVKPPPSDPDIGALDEDAVQELGPLEKHHMALRWIAVIVAILVILAASVLEIWVLRHLPRWESMGDLTVLLAITPMVSVTIIVAFILIGVFRRSGDKEMDLSSLARIASQSLRGSPE